MASWNDDGAFGSGDEVVEGGTAKTFDGGCGACDPVLEDFEDFEDFVIAASDWLEMRGNGDAGRARTAL